MNLHAIASPYIAAVNPWLTAQWLQSISYATNADGSRSPAFATAVSAQIQFQALSFEDLKQVDGLNLNGVKNALYVNGDIEGVNRPDARGGDIFILLDGSKWLVVQVLENWIRTAGWTKCAVVLQPSGN